MTSPYSAAFRVLQGTGMFVAVIGSDPDADPSTIGTEANPAIQVAQMHQDGRPVNATDNRFRGSVPPGTLTPPAEVGPVVITGADYGGDTWGFDLSAQTGQLFALTLTPAGTATVALLPLHASSVAQRFSVELPALADGINAFLVIESMTPLPLTWVGEAPPLDGSPTEAMRIDLWCTGDGTFTAAVVSAVAVELGPVLLAPLNTGAYTDKTDGTSFEVDNRNQCDVIEVSNDINSGTGQPLTFRNPGEGNWAVVQLRVYNSDLPAAVPLLDLPGYVDEGVPIVDSVTGLNVLLLTLTITGTSGSDPTVLLTYDTAYAT
jgi:hypothetical protein